MKQIAIAYAATLFVLSVITFLLYGFDKGRARIDGRRIPEKTLQLFALFGGWPGALCGQQYFRHKTKKASFQITFWLCVILHIAAIAGFFYVMSGID
jgi:uncharacterized membrane protein YsdA (DUF1294 family)